MCLKGETGQWCMSKRWWNRKSLILPWKTFYCISPRRYVSMDFIENKKMKNTKSTFKYLSDVTNCIPPCQAVMRGWERQQPQRDQWPVLLLMETLKVWGFLGYYVVYKARIGIYQYQVGFWIWGWDLGLMARVWAFCLEFGPWGCDLTRNQRLSLQAAIRAFWQGFEPHG